MPLDYYTKFATYRSKNLVQRKNAETSHSSRGATSRGPFVHGRAGSGPYHLPQAGRRADAQLQVFMATNAVLIREAASQQNIALPTLDVNMKSAPPLRLVPEEAVAAKSRFVTLEPGVSCDILRVPFRPRGATRKSVEGARAETARDGFLFAQLGMHLLEPGREYTVQVKSGVRISSWMEGRVEDLIREGPGEWRPRPDAINVLPAEGFRFRVED